MLDFHSKMKKSIFSAKIQSKILKLVFQGYYNLVPTHFSTLLDYYLLIQTLWSSQTDVLIIPHTYYVHSTPPLVFCSYWFPCLESFPHLFSLRCLPFLHLNFISFLPVTFLYKFSDVLALSSMGNLSHYFFSNKMWAPFPSCSQISHCVYLKPGQLYSQLLWHSSLRQVVHQKSPVLKYVFLAKARYLVSTGKKSTT